MQSKSKRVVDEPHVQSKSKRIVDEQSHAALDQLIQITQLGKQYTKQQLIQLNLKDVLVSYQPHEHSVREWAQYVQGFSFCLQKQYGALKQDLITLHQSMMSKELFYGEAKPERESRERESRPRRQPRRPAVAQVLNAVEQLQDQSDSSISNPRNIASNDMLRLQEMQQAQLHEVVYESHGVDSNDVQDIVFDDIRVLESQTFQDVLRGRKLKESGGSTPQIALLPQILINNEELQMDQQSERSLSSGTRNIAIMRQFNEVIDLPLASQQQQQQQRKPYTGRIIMDDLPLQQEYQRNVDTLMSATDRMDELNNRMSLLNYHQEFWRTDYDDLFQKIDQVQAQLHNINTDSNRKSSIQKNLIGTEDKTERLRKIELPYDGSEIAAFEDLTNDQRENDQEEFGGDDQQFMTEQLPMANKEEFKLYNRVLFDIKRESDEKEIQFEEFFRIRSKTTQVGAQVGTQVMRATAFYELLVMARLGQVEIHDHRIEDSDQFSVMGIEIK